MAADFDRVAFMGSLKAGLAEKERATQLGVKLAHKRPSRLLLVGCGSPNRQMQVVRYWVEREAQAMEVRTYFPAELI